MAHWWAGDRSQRYWVEIRWRTGIGRSLRCPLTREDGGTDPWYDLVGEVRPGDMIYHWHARAHRFVGRSMVARSPAVLSGEWVVELEEFEPIRVEIALRHIRDHERQLVAIRDRLEQRYSDIPLYLPFQFRSDGLRFISNYFAKLPQEVVDLLFDESGLGEGGIAEPDPEDGPPVTPATTKPRISYLQPFQEKADTVYIANVQGHLQRRGRKHESLVNGFASWLLQRGYAVGRNAAVDLGLEDPPLVIEAKIITSWPKAIREAVGQLYEYRYFKVADPESGLIFLSSAEVPPEWVSYLERDREIGVVWQRVNHTFELSRLAELQLDL